jgi:hypothetical protein
MRAENVIIWGGVRIALIHAGGEFHYMRAENGNNTCVRRIAVHAGGELH